MITNTCSVLQYWSCFFFLNFQHNWNVSLFPHSWKRILVWDAWCWWFLLRAWCTNHWSLSGSEAQKWRFVITHRKLLFPFSTVKLNAGMYLGINVHNINSWLWNIVAFKNWLSHTCCPTGLITLDELHQRVLKGRGKYAQDVSQ